MCGLHLQFHPLQNYAQYIRMNINFQKRICKKYVGNKGRESRNCRLYSNLSVFRTVLPVFFCIFLFVVFANMYLLCTVYLYVNIFFMYSKRWRDCGILVSNKFQSANAFMVFKNLDFVYFIWINIQVII